MVGTILISSAAPADELALGLRVPEAAGLDDIRGELLALAEREALAAGVRVFEAELLLSLPQAVKRTRAESRTAPNR
jgi:hypothetical protein